MTLRVAGAAALGCALLAPFAAEGAGGEAPVRLPGTGPEVVSVQARPPQRVLLSVSVLDGRGEPVIGLTGKDFLVLEDGVERPILDFSREGDRADRPLSAMFLLDRSLSMRGQLARWQEAVPALLSAMRPIDEVGLSVVAGGDREVLQDFTADPALVEASIRNLTAKEGGTSLFPAVEDSLRDLRRRAGRKVLFLLTDGLDDTHAGTWSTTHDRYLGRLLAMAVSNEVTIVTILPSPSSRPYLAVQDLAIQTGGWWLYPGDDLPGLIKRLGRRLLESYHVAFDSLQPPGERRRRRVEVRIARPGAEEWEVRTVAGVFGQEPLVALLEEELGDEDEAHRAAAATALGMVAHPRAGGALKRALGDDSPKVRAAAAAAIGRRGEAAPAGKLSGLLRDPDPAVRGAALEALQALLRKAVSEKERTRILDALESAED